MIATEEPLVTATNLSMFYGGRRVDAKSAPALQNVNLEIRPGETVGVVGESGSGKTTLGRILVGLLRPTSGFVSFSGRDVTRLSGRALRPLRRDMQIVFQDPTSSLNLHMRVGELIREPLDVHRLGSRTEREGVVDQLMEQVGLSASLRTRHPHELSGGQQQRVGIARALALRPRFLVADEPVSALDVSSQAQVLNLLLDLKEQLALTYLFISHDVAVTRYISDRIIVLYSGRVVESGPADVLVDRPVHPYTKLLLAAEDLSSEPTSPNETSPRVDAARETGPQWTSQSSCCFVSRCIFRQDICFHVEPDLRAQHEVRQIACHFADQIGTGVTPDRIPQPEERITAP